MNILNKYKDIMFRENVFGLPNFTMPVPIQGIMGDIKDGAASAWNHTKEGVNAAGRGIATGARAAVNGVTDGIEAAGMGVADGINAAGKGISNLSMPKVNGMGVPGMPGMPGIGGVTMPGLPNMPGIKKVKFPSLGKMPKLMPNLSSLDPNKLVFGDIFKQFDKDRSGYLDYNEFCELTKYMGLFLDKEESLKLFSMADTSNNNQIEMREFKNAMALLKMRIAYETLRKLGLTIEDLVWYGILGMVFLLLVFVFIFLGISAFSKAEGFNAVINSFLPLTAGAAAAARKIDIQGAFEKVKGFVQKTITRLKSR